MRNVCGTEGNPNVIEVLKLLNYLKCSHGNIRLTDWNSRTEQRERPQRDRFIARVLWNLLFLLNSFWVWIFREFYFFTRSQEASSCYFIWIFNNYLFSTLLDYLLSLPKIGNLNSQKDILLLDDFARNKIYFNFENCWLRILGNILLKILIELFWGK